MSGVVDGRVLAQTLGVGLERLEPQLPAMRGITPRGELAVALAQSELPTRLTVNAVRVVGGASARAMRQRLHEQSSWFARNLYKSAAAQAKELRKVRGAATAGAAVVVGVVGGALYAINKIGEVADRTHAATMIDSLVAMACVGPDGTIPPHNEVLRSCILDQFKLRNDKRVALLDTPPQGELSQIQELSIPEVIQPTVGVLLFHARAGALDGTPSAAEQAQKDLLPFMIRMGMSLSGARDFATNCASNYLKRQPFLTEHYQVLQASVAGIGLNLRLPLDAIMYAVTEAARYDPYEEGRRANRALAAQVIKTGGRLTISHLAGNAHPALSIAATVASHFFLTTGGPDRSALTTAFQQYCFGQGIDGSA